MPVNAFEPYTSPTEVTPQARRFYRSWSFWLMVVFCLVAMAAVPIAFLIGGISGNTQIYNNFANRQQDRIEAYLAEDLEAFGGLKVRHASNGWAFPSGEVATQADFDRLERQLHKMFGDELAERMMVSVEIAPR